MSRTIVLTDEQAKIISESAGNVVLRDTQGRHLGYVSNGFAARDIAEAKRRLATPGRSLSTGDVIAKLQELKQN